GTGGVGRFGIAPSVWAIREIGDGGSASRKRAFGSYPSRHELILALVRFHSMSAAARTSTGFELLRCIIRTFQAPILRGWWQVRKGPQRSQLLSTSIAAAPPSASTHAV